LFICLLQIDIVHWQLDKAASGIGTWYVSQLINLVNSEKAGDSEVWSYT
jgi:hypothetical protein